MPLKFIKQLNDQERKIFERFRADVERLGNDLHEDITVMQIGKENDREYIITHTEQIFDDNARRVEMMADSLTWQSYQLGIAQALFEDTDIVEWNLNPSAEHCKTCQEYAAIRYFTIDTLPGLPGTAPTICDGGCKCYLT